jgi:hypothetical protein
LREVVREKEIIISGELPEYSERFMADEEAGLPLWQKHLSFLDRCSGAI